MEHSPCLTDNDFGNLSKTRIRSIRLISLIMLSLLSYAQATAQWQHMQHDSTLMDNFYSSVHFVADATGFLVGCTGSSSWDAELLHKTSNAGASWSTIRGSGGGGTCRIPNSFVNGNSGYCILSYGTAQPVDLMKTTDGGASWNNLVPASGLSLGAFTFDGTVYFFSDMLGFIAKEDTLYRTSDGGESWQQVSSGHFIKTLFFTTAQTGYAAGDNIILKTTDGGLNWTVPETGYSILSLSFSSADIGYAVGAQGTIIKTTDAGNTWSAQFSGLPPSIALHSVVAINDNFCFAVGDSGTILHTSNGGNNWIMQNSGLTAGLKSISCSPSRCYAVGDTSVILETTEGIVGIGPLKNIKDGIVAFPNPFSKQINIKVNDAIVTRVVMHNVTGRKFEMKYSKSGQEITIDRGDLPAGVYFIRLMHDGGTLFSGKAVIID